MKKHIITTLSIFLAIILSVQPSVFFKVNALNTEKTIYVSENGSDSASGSVVRPLKTLHAVEKKISEISQKKNIRVILSGGTYELDSTLKLNRSNVSFEAADGEKVFISGAKKVDNWKEINLNGVRVFEASANGKNITALFKSDEKLTSARFPESGYFYVESTNDEDNLWTEETTPNPQILGSHSFNAKKTDVNFVPSNLNDISVCIVHMWQEELSAVTSIDAKTGKVCLEKYASHTIEKGDRFFFDNVIEALDKSGEWCLDSRQNKIFYVPQDDETVDNVEIFASSTTKLINIDSASNITFKNIIFKNTGWEYASAEYFTIHDFLHGYGVDIDVSQAGIDVCAAVTAIRSSNLSFKNCEFINIGCTALKIMDECKNVLVENCYLDGIGASGIFAGGQNSEDGAAQNITVRNCIIGNYGQKFYRAPGIIFTFVNGGEIINNEIHDGNYTGISCGWIWLYGYHVTQNINIQDNLIYNIGLGMLSDMGGIYMLGIQKGSKVHGNVIHDVLCYEGESGYAGTGIYTDAGSSEMELYNNLVYNCSTAGFNATIGRNNVWYNNIVAFCGARLVNPPQNYMDFISGAEYRNNILLTDNGVPVFVSLEESELFKEENNLMWDMSYGDFLFFAPHFSDRDTMTLKRARRKRYISKSSVAADPLFVDALNYDFTLRDNSPAFALGFEAWDYNNAGTLSGTTVGLNHKGGQTAYNENIKQCKYIEPSLSLAAKIAKFFFNVGQFFKNIFTK